MFVTLLTQKSFSWSRRKKEGVGSSVGLFYCSNTFVSDQRAQQAEIKAKASFQRKDPNLSFLALCVCQLMQLEGGGVCGDGIVTMCV